MAPLTVVALAKCKCYQRIRKDETPEMYIKRLTHFGLSKHGITELTDALHHCQNAAAFFLYENMIPEIKYFDNCRSLTQLYLQHNRIKVMENLKPLIMLEKLYLGGNEILVVEGLESLQGLKELHIENQRLPAGEKLIFDPRCFMGISKSLKILNVAGNRLDDLNDIARLERLTTLNLCNNFVRNLRELGLVLKRNDYLQHLRIAGNPICHLNKMREKIIPMAGSLQMLDAEAITPIQRQFLENFAIMRAKGKKPKKPQNHDSQERSSGRYNASRGLSNRKDMNGARELRASDVLFHPPQARFPSKFSSRNPHWLPPLPTITKATSEVANLESTDISSRNGRLPF